MRTILRALAPLLVSIGLLAAAPANASAATAYIGGCVRSDSAVHGCNVRLSSLSTYQGWARMTGTWCVGAATVMLPAPQPVAAWRWTGSSWQRASLSPGQRVYIYPYATDWSWAWTQSTGWLAVHDSTVVINYYCQLDAFGR